MPRNYKICVVSHPTESENKLFDIKPNANNFDTFKNEIYIRMPELMEHSLTFFYQDVEGKTTTISNDTDFEAFHGKNISKMFVTKINATANPEQARHANVICDGCDKEISGHRYKCLECQDFDLCSDCEPTRHYHHLMIRVEEAVDDETRGETELSDRFMRRCQRYWPRLNGKLYGLKRHRKDHPHRLFHGRHHHGHEMHPFHKKHGHHGKHLKRPHHFHGPHHHNHHGPRAFGHPHSHHSMTRLNPFHDILREHVARFEETTDNSSAVLIDLSDSDDEDAQILIR